MVVFYNCIIRVLRACIHLTRYEKAVVFFYDICSGPVVTPGRRENVKGRNEREHRGYFVEGLRHVPRTPHRVLFDTVSVCCSLRKGEL